MTYEIRHDYIKHGNARPGTKLVGPLFVVAHDIGNGASTAQNNQTYFNNHQPSASAHVFIDDKEILVIIPLDEKAWHVQYQKPMDNILYGDDANDAAIGVELCWGGKINFEEAYKRYVWFFAWLCKKYKWEPYKKIVSHKKLDPERRSDPDNALNRHGITFQQFLNDVENTMKNETSKPESEWKPVKIISAKYGLYSEPGTKWKEVSNPFIGWTFVARKKQMVKGQMWYEIYLGEVSYGWVSAVLVEERKHTWAVTKEDTFGYIHADLKQVCNRILKGSKIAILEEQNDKFLVVSHNHPQWIGKKLVKL